MAGQKWKHPPESPRFRIQTRLILFFFFFSHALNPPSFKINHRLLRNWKCTYDELCKFSYKNTKTGKAKTLYHTGNSVVMISFASLSGLRNMYYGESIRKRGAQGGKMFQTKKLVCRIFILAAATSFYFPKS